MKRNSWSMLALAVAALAAPGASAAQPVTFLDQGWSKEMRDLFYFTPQGSRMVPYEWFMALETPDGRDLFSGSANLTRYGFIPADGPSELNPGGLPIGFAVEPKQGSEPRYQTLGTDPVGAPSRELGLTCAACHTANVTVDGKTVRVDGGPANVDFDSFYADLAAAVTRTLVDQDAFARFAGRLFPHPSPTGAATLRLQLAEFQAKIAGDAAIRRPALQSGFGRVDALTQILNALAVTDQSDPLNLRPVDAPTSFPHLWLAPQLEWVQWNPIAASPIGRNGGEVLGVFGTAELTGDKAAWFGSSLQIRNLHALELWLTGLEPPRWDEAVFGGVDRRLAAEGEDLYRRHCAGCHNMPPYERTDPEENAFKRTFIKIGRVDYRKVGTDPTYVEGLNARLVRTNEATRSLMKDQPVVPATGFFVYTVGAVVGRALDDAGLTPQEKLEFNGYRFRPAKKPGDMPEPYAPPSTTDLKAGPLTGIWATGPFLHNGSVATVYELLSPVGERRTVFWTGGRDLDRERLGFASEDAPGRFRFDAGLPGNRNIGHLYPASGLTPEERRAIVEFLKLL